MSLSKIDISSKLKSLSYSSIFEFYFLVSIISYLLRQGLPKNTDWLIILLIKVALGYLSYRLYISKDKKTAVKGVLLVLVLIAVPYIMPFINPIISTTLGGYATVLLSANTFFFIRYFKNPQVILSNKRMNKIVLIVNLIIICWTTIEILVDGTESGLLQLFVVLNWIVFYVEAEGIIPLKSRTIKE